jgi:hypothetical protein
MAFADLYRMRITRTLAVLTLSLVVGWMLPALCLALPSNAVTGSGSMHGGCHDHSAPAHCPIHSCCYSQHPQPAAVKATAPPRVALSAAPGSIVVHDPVQSANRFIPKVNIKDSSLLLSTVLRV